MTMLLSILAAVVIIIAVLAAVIALRPSEFRIARTATIAAPAPVVFAEVNDFRRWLAWSPFEKSDPAMHREFSGAPAGEGAVFAWSGNKQAGEGRATIVESRSDALVRMRLDFVRPFAGTNEATFALQPQGDRTVVTWSMTGKANFMFKAIGLFMNCEKMCGDQFEQGLAKLGSVVEGHTAALAAGGTPRAA
jgi:hypothetical protein